MLLLEVIQGVDAGSRYEVTEFPVTIGRSDTCGIVLRDYHISGEHLQISQVDGQYVVEDLRSTNGSELVRGNRRIVLQGPDSWSHVLEDGDRLLLGDPSSPVILACSVRSEKPEDVGEVVAKKSREEVEAIAGKLQAGPSDLALLYRASVAIARAGLDLNGVLTAVAEQVFELLPGATHVTILLNEGPGDRYVPVLAKAKDPKAGAVPFSRAVLRRVLGDRAAVLVANAAAELGGTQSLMAAKIMSSIGVPLWKGDVISGVLQVDNRTSSGIFRERDLEILAVLASQAALAIENARLYQRLETLAERAQSEAQYFRERSDHPLFEDIVGVSPAMQKVFDQLRKVIDTRATIHIYGETGTGKELVARAVHYEGSRRDKLFVAANCAAMPDTLLESELFGHVRGAFTGADRDKKGLFEVADGGTLFLDEIGEMSFSLQARLLRVLQNGEIRPVGSSRTKKVDVRIISATNKDLEEEVRAGRFRQDLYYRLMVFPIRLPPLRERREDIPVLARHFLKKYCAEYGKTIQGFTQEALDMLLVYKWPGNVRELEHEIQRLVIQCDDGAFIKPEDLSPQIQAATGGLPAAPRGTLKERLAQVERWILKEALEEHGNNKTKAAKALGITREGLHKKLAKYGLH